MVSELSDATVEEEWFGLFAMRKKMGRRCCPTVYSSESYGIADKLTRLPRVVAHAPPLRCTAGFSSHSKQRPVSYSGMICPLDTVKRGEQLDRRPNQRHIVATMVLSSKIDWHVTTKMECAIIQIICHASSTTLAT